MGKQKSTAQMNLRELEKGINASWERIKQFEAQLTIDRKTAQVFLAELSRPQRQFERNAGLNQPRALKQPSGNRKEEVGGRRAARGSVAESIVTALGKSSKPLSVDEIVFGYGGPSRSLLLRRPS